MMNLPKLNYKGISVLAMMLLVCSAIAEPLRVGFLSPAPAEAPFWKQLIEPMQEVARDLNIELVVQYSKRGDLAIKRSGNILLNTKPRIDYFLTSYRPTITPFHLRLAKRRGIKVFMINSDVVEKDRADVGVPRGRYQNWIGQLLPDDGEAGRKLAEVLIDSARKGEVGKKELKLFAFVGESKSQVGRNRKSGLHIAVNAANDVVLHELGMASWLPDWAYEETTTLLKAGKQIDIIWTPSEATAWGAFKAVEDAGRKPGEDIYIGGFDWNADSLQALADGRMSASMFGHFLEGAWALILIYDYHNGIDFNHDPGVRSLTGLSALTPKNYRHYQKILQDGYWKRVDFRKMSKKYNSKIKKYNFSIDRFLN